MTDTCGNCRYFMRNVEPNGQIGQGFCHINPPAVFLLPVPSQGPLGPQMTTQVVSQWPVVMVEQWCGKHEEGGVVKLDGRVVYRPTADGDG